MLEENDGEDVHPTISSIFMEAATEAIQNMSDVSYLIVLFSVIMNFFCFSSEIFLILASRRELVNYLEVFF